MRVVLTVGARIHLDFAKLKRRDKDCAKAIRKEFTHSNSKWHMLHNKHWSTKGVPKKFYSYTKKNNMPHEISRGGISKLKKIIREHGHKVKVIDGRLSLPPVDFGSKIILRHEQKEPVVAMVDKQQGILRGPCSSGKTVMLLEAIAECRQPAIVVVWDTIHQKHWIKESKKFFHLDKDEIGGCGGMFKKPKVGLLNICMQQSLKNEKIRELYVDHIGFLGGDEIQRFAAATFQDVINDFPAKYRIGVTANERRRDGKHVLVQDTFGKVIVQIPDEDIGSRRPAKIFMIPTNYCSEEFTVSDNRPALLNEMAEDRRRNNLIKKSIKRSLKKKKFCLILTERKWQVLMLRSYFERLGFKVGILVGDTSAKEIRESRWKKSWKKFMTGFDKNVEFDRVAKLGARRKLDLTICTQKGDVGLNIRTFDHVFVTTPTGANLERFNQQKGRVERDHDKKLEKLFGRKKTPHLYYFWDTKMEKLQEAGNKVISAYANVNVLNLRKE